jgi:hypothetical protein
MKMADRSVWDRRISRVHETGRSAFSPVFEIVELNSTPQCVWPPEEDDCKSSIPGASALCDGFHCLLRESMS